MGKSYKAFYIFILWLLIAPPLQAQFDAVRVSEAYQNQEKNSGWIELYHSGSLPVELADLAISIGDLVIRPDSLLFQPGSYLVIGIGADQGFDQYFPDASFKAGHSISLDLPESGRVDKLVFVPTGDGKSYGREIGTGRIVVFEQPSPGSPPQGEVLDVQLSPPTFSVPPGFYTDAFELELETIHTGAEIRFTTDGSLPGPDSELYTEAISITDRAGDPNDISMIPTNPFDSNHPYDEHWLPPAGEVKKLNIIRARVFFPGADESPVSSGSFFVDPLGAGYFDMPVISISTDRENFFDADIGIYVFGNASGGNYNQRGIEWERPVFMEFFEDDGLMGFAQDLGARIHGGTSRSRPRKSLRLYARSDYGPSWVNYQFFPDKPISEFKRFLLRNSGNDWDRAIFRDAFMQSLIRDLKVDIQYSRAAVVFLNGEYWGIHNIRDRLDDRYIQTHYGLDEDQYTIMENNSVHAGGSTAGIAHYNNMRSFINGSSMAIPANYNVVKTQMDVDNFIDYQAAQIYFRNTDWPGNNLQYWRSNNDYNPDAPYGLDGRWRWMMFDTDFGFNLDFDYVTGHPEGPAHNTLAFALQAGNNNWPNPDWSTMIFRNLVQNTEFRNGFINRFADLLNTNFREDVVTARIDSMQAIYENGMQEHIDRWRRPATVETWENILASMRSFGQQRPGFMRQFIMQQFNLPGTAEITLAVNDTDMGIIQINRTKIEPGREGVGNPAYPWTGIYFRNVPVSFTAIPKSGYRFVGWQGGSTSDEAAITITPTGDFQLTALFEPDEEETGDLDPWMLSGAPYIFSEWPADSAPGTYPPSMIFLQSGQLDPTLDTPMDFPWIHPYDLDNRSRVNGLGSDGFGFINTGNAQENGGGFQGAAVLAINTIGLDDISVTWRGGTVRPNSRVYNVRLQYRVGATGDYEDVLDSEGNPVEYERNAVEGHSQIIGPVVLPSSVNNREYVELRWKYYYTGIRLDENSGQRSKIRVGDILVTHGAQPEPAGIVFDEYFPTAQAGKTAAPIVVRVLTEGGHTDVNFNGEITIGIESGPGDLSGTMTVQAEGGIAVFDSIGFSNMGIYVLSASADGLEPVTTTPIRVVELTEIVLPKYIQGNQPDNDDRIPFAFRLRIDGLMANTAYRYYNRVIDDEDPFDQDGAGNAIFVEYDGGNFIRTTSSPRFRPADFGDRHYEFVTDANGSYEGWFITEPSGNNRFTPGNMLRIRLLLNDGGDGEDIHHYIDTFSEIRVLRFGPVPGQATGLVGLSTAVPRNFVVLYDNEQGEDRPVAATFVEHSGIMFDSRFAGFYLDLVNGLDGSFGTMLPNDLPNGVRRIEEWSLLDGFVVSSITSPNGVWGDGIGTVNPSGGLESPIVINLGDALPIENDGETPAEFYLSQNYPNPFNPSTQITYGLPESVHVRIEVYSINGQLVTVLQNGVQSAGTHSVTFDSRNTNIASGVYLYRIEAGEFVQVKKMMLIK